MTRTEKILAKAKAILYMPNYIYEDMKFDYVRHNKSKHTPTPWEYNGEVILHDSKPNQPFGGGVMPVCELYTDANGGNWQGNAEFIVRACNAHYDLLVALHHARALIIVRGADRTKDERAIGLYDRALAKAQVTR